jgi:glycosyltransferase involved in cell wall biosynthesis
MEECLEQLIECLASQTLKPAEIIVVNNFSAIEKKKALEVRLAEISQKLEEGNCRARVITLPDSEFSHPYSTNLGVAAAENEFVCITNAHSLPVSAHWLQDGMKRFREPEVAGVSGYFFPRGSSEAHVATRALYLLSQRNILHQNWCSTMNCIIRKSLWKHYPFDENLPALAPETRRYGLEDYDWSKEMLARGHRIIIDPLFSVFHSHSRGLEEIARNMRRYFVYRRIQRRIDMFERPRESFSRALRECYTDSDNTPNHN